MKPFTLITICKTLTIKNFKIMKKVFFPFAAFAALVLCASCNKEEMPKSNAETPVQGEALVSVVANTGFETKATGIKDDATDTKKVNSLQVFAFDSEGVLRAYESTTSGSSVSMKLNTGKEYTFYAVANNYGGSAWKYAGVASATSASSLASIITDLKDNAKDNLLMYSQTGVKKTIDKNVSSVSIEVTRLVSKVQIKKIVVDFGTNTALKSKSFKIDSIYVINAAAKETFGLAPESTVTYYNQAKFISGNADALLLDKLATPFELSSSAGVAKNYETVHTFFTYGNKTTKPTRLVVSCNWGGERTYYPINIAGNDSALTPNCAYIINQLTIKGLGSDDPDVVPERKDFTASVTVKDWGTGFEKTVEL